MSLNRNLFHLFSIKINISVFKFSALKKYITRFHLNFFRLPMKWLINYSITYGSGSSTSVEHTPHNREFVGSIPAGEVQHYGFSYKY